MGEKPTVEIVRESDDSVEIYINGKEVAYAGHDADGFNGMRKVVDTAKAVAQALGATVVDASQPSPEPYRYFVVYQSEAGHLGNVFHTTLEPIEDIEAVMRLTEEIMNARPSYGHVVVTNFILVDGPC